MAATEHPLVGRTAEVARVRDLVAAAAAGAGCGLLVVGDPGAGKTRLVRAAADEAAAAGLAVRTGRAQQLEVERTLGAGLAAFGLRLDQLAGPATAARTVLEAGAGAAGAFLLADRLLEVVEAACADGPVLLAVEDLHWADPATLAWLRAVLDRAPALPLAVLLTARPPDPGSPLHRAQAGWALPRLDLGPLDPADVRVLATAVLGEAPGDRPAAALDAAAGNPLLVLAVLDAVAAGEQPRTDAIAGRLDELDGPVLRTLQVAAVLGEHADPAVVAELAGVRTATVLAHIDAAVAAGVAARTGGFRHELYREAVLARLTAPAVSALHLDAARLLVAAQAPAEVVAGHFARGARPGDREAVAWMTRAAEDLVPVAPAAALRLVDVALPLCGPRPPPDLLLVRVRALAGAGRVAEADALGRSLLRDTLAAPAEAQLRRELAFTAFVQGRATDAVAEMERTTRLVRDPGLRARALGEVAFARFLAVDHPGARDAALRAVTAGRRSGEPTAQVAGASVLAFLELLANRTAEAARWATEATDLAEQPGTAEAHVFQPWFVAAVVWLETDRIDRLVAVARRGREVAAERGSAWALPAYDAVSAFGALRTGSLDDAAAVAEGTLGYLEGVDGFGVAVWCHAFLAQVALHRGDDDTAAVHVATAEEWLVRDRAQLGFEQLRLAASALHERRGDPETALRALAEPWDLFTAVGIRSALPAIGVPLARLAALSGDRDRSAAVARVLTECADTAGTPSVQAVARLATAWHRTDPDLALAAAALAGRTPRRPVAAAALADAATLLRLRGRLREAGEVAGCAARRWVELGADGEAVRCAGPGRRPPDRPRFGVDALTATERLVVGLVAEGLANAAIARRLGVSRRTVESHVSAAYRKLEVASRVELARLALAHGLAGVGRTGAGASPPAGSA